MAGVPARLPGGKAGYSCTSTTVSCKAPASLLHQPACIGCRAACRILQLEAPGRAPGRARQLLHLFTKQKILDHWLR